MGAFGAALIARNKYKEGFVATVAALLIAAKRHGHIAVVVVIDEDGTFREVQIYGKSYKGKELYDVLETYVRRASTARDTKT